MKKLYVFLTLLFIFSFNLFSQDFCGGDHFYDSGGEFDNYGNNEEITTVIQSDNGESIEIIFLSFVVEYNFDFLTVYDGPDAGSPLLGTFTGTDLPGPFTSNNINNSLTFVFTSDGSITRSGWDAVVHCQNVTCASPSNILVSNISYNTIDINWDSNGDENSWEIEYGIEGFINGNGIVIQVNENPYQLSNLDSGTHYDLYLRANCGIIPGDDDSSWIGPIPFTTVSDFCNGDHFYDSGGANENYTNNENYTTVISPQDADVVTVTFISFDLENNYDFLNVFDGPDNTYPSLGTFSGNEIPDPFTSTDVSGSLTFVFTSDHSVTRQGWEAIVQCNFVSCPKPTNIISSNITATSVELNWDAGGVENNWEIEYGFQGFNHGEGTIESTNTNPFVLTGLEQGSRQDIYIRANCGIIPGEDDSNWSDVVTISTPCGLFTAPFVEDFDSDDTPGCWFEFGSEQWHFGTDASFSAASAGDHTNGGGTNYAYIDGSGPSGEGHISNLVTPWIDISNLNIPVVQFSIFSQNDNDQTYNTLDVILHEQNGTNTNLLHLQGTTNGWQQFAFIDTEDININDTQIQIEFTIEENSPGNSFYNDILIDDIIIEEGTIIGLNDNLLESILIYPNPTTDLLTISSEKTISNIQIYDILGKRINTKKITNSTNLLIDLSDYTNGVYYIKIFTDNESQSFKVIKN